MTYGEQRCFICQREYGSESPHRIEVADGGSVYVDGGCKAAITNRARAFNVSEWEATQMVLARVSETMLGRDRAGTGED